MATKRNGDGFERMKDYTTSGSDSDGEGLGDFDSDSKRLSSSREQLCPPSKEKLKRRDVICVIIGAIIVGVAILVFVILAVALQGSGRGSSSSQYDQVRLPTDLEPELYTIHLSVDFDTLEVTGSETIKIRVVSPTDQIILHFNNMTITDTSLTVNGNDLGAVKDTYTIEDNDFFVASVGKLNVGDDVQLSLTFSYKLSKGLAGFYLSTYQNLNGDTVKLATTQFEPTDARKAFPCFDEPAMKANFSIRITHPNGYKATSNMPVKSSANRDKRDTSTVTTEFETSYRMSTYLVAFIVSDFECSVPTKVKGRITVRICASPVVFNSTSYAQSVTDDVIGYYEDFFGVDYPLPKQDLFAIPDFSAGAMENWGLITYRETALLYDPTQNPLVSKQRVAVVIAHELAHQWFGNLVTMDWWDGLWLNEGFASYVEYIGADHKEKEWKMLDQFFVATIQYAYAADGLNFSHPILQEVYDPDEINSLFDSISYDKGASLIRMLLNYVGEKDFTKGLANYLNYHKFGNAKTSELWEAMDEVTSSTPSISAMMDTWTKQMGYPVVTVSRKSDTTLSYTQERFILNPLPSGGKMAPSPYNYRWVIPFTYIISTSPNDEKIQVLQNAQDTITLEGSLGGGAFLKVNHLQNGFYRVNYDEANWKAITDHLISSADSKVLSGVDRAGLLDDSFALSHAGLLNLTKALDLSLYLRNERDYVPWRAAFRWFASLSNVLSLTPAYGKYQRYLAYLINDTVQEFSFNRTNLTHLETFLRVLILQNAWETGNEAVAMKAKDMFDAWMKDSTKMVPPNLRQVVYPAGISFGGEKEWNYLWNHYLTVNDPYEKSLCLSALSHSKEPWILNRYLEYVKDKIRAQDGTSVIIRVSQNIRGRYLAWNFFRDNYDFIFARYGGSSFSFSRLIKSITESFSTEWELQEIESFFDGQRDTGSATLAVDQAKETVRGNIQWLESNLNVIDNWISTNVP